MKRPPFPPPGNLPSPSFQGSPRLMFAARFTWLFLAGACLLVFLLLTPRDFRQLMFQDDFTAAVGFLESARAMRFFTLYLMGLRIVALLVYLGISLFIFILGVWRHSHPDWTAWLASLALLFSPLIFGLGGYEEGTYVPVINDILQAIRVLLGALGIISSVIFINVFPSGQFSPVWVGRLALGWLVVIFAVLPWFQGVEAAWFFMLGGFVLVLGVSIYGQVYRYQHVSTPAQRLQTRWVIFGLAAQGFWLLNPLFAFLDRAGLPYFDILAAWFNLHLPVFLPLLFPLTLAASILRYRLWDIDLVIRKTLQYTLLTAILALVYFGSITLLQSISTAAFGLQSPVMVVISTLAIAALFNPLRTRTQAFVDRRFFRSKYDAEHALAEFAAAARSETDPEQISAYLAHTVQQTLQPKQVAIWISSIGKSSSERRNS